MKTEIHESELYQDKIRSQEPSPVVKRVWLEGLTYQCCFIQEQYTWEEARAYLQELSLLEGYRWRLPTLAELEKLLTKAPSQNINGEPYYMVKSFLDFMPQESIFWSASMENRFGVWVVDFNQGMYYLRDKTNRYHLLAVCESKLV